jgi:hypothetical protein
LSSLLLDEDRKDEAILVLRPPSNPGILAFMASIVAFLPNLLCFFLISDIITNFSILFVNCLEATLENVYRAKPWWLDENIKVKLAYIYKAKGMSKAFVDMVFPLVRDSLLLRKVRCHFIPKNLILLFPTCLLPYSLSYPLRIYGYA